MRGEHSGEVSVLLARWPARRKAIDEAVLIPPIAGEKIARDAAVIAAGAVGVGQPVMRGKAGERRRR
jgi:hypothetical protein